MPSREVSPPHCAGGAGPTSAHRAGRPRLGHWRATGCPGLPGALGQTSVRGRGRCYLPGTPQRLALNTFRHIPGFHPDKPQRAEPRSPASSEGHRPSHPPCSRAPHRTAGSQLTRSPASTPPSPLLPTSRLQRHLPQEGLLSGLPPPPVAASGCSPTPTLTSLSRG